MDSPLSEKLVNHRVLLSPSACPTLCDPMECSLPGLLSLGFPRQEYWSGLPFPPPGGLLDPEVEPMSPAFASEFFTTESQGELPAALSYP